MKKKGLSLCLAAVLAAAAIIGGTLAYFTDTDNATNTFTVGGVQIALIEQQRDGNGALEDFRQGKNLMPIVGSAQGEKDALGLPTAANYVDKVVTVTNTGASGAYVRAYFAIPSALDDGYETFNAGENVLHLNFGNRVSDGEVFTTFGAEWNWMHDGKWNYFETTMDGTAYNVYYADYYQPLAAGATTERLIDGVYLDKNVDMDAEGNYFISGKTLDLSILEGEVQCPVMAVAVQAAGFTSADDAVTEAFGARFNPFGGEVSNWQ